MIIRLVPVFARTSSTSLHAFSSGSSAQPLYHNGPFESYNSASSLVVSAEFFFGKTLKMITKSRRDLGVVQDMGAVDEVEVGPSSGVSSATNQKGS